MANVSLKKDFIDGEKLFAQQLNNNFGAIQAALETMNKIVWQDDPDDSVTTFRGTTEEINARDIIDGQLLYDTTTGETYIDYGSQRISTGSGNAIFIGDTEPTNPSTQLWIEPNEPLQVIGSEVVNSLDGNETNKAPSVSSVNTALDAIVDAEEYSETETKTNKVWIDGSAIYRKVYSINIPTANTDVNVNLDISNLSQVVNLYGLVSSSGIFVPVNYNFSSNNVRCYITAQQKIQITSAFTGTAKVIVEYTKTESSVSIAPIEENPGSQGGAN